MKEIDLKEYMKKAGQMLEKYRSKLDHLQRLRADIESQFFIPEEMVQYFHSNKSEYYAWQQIQESIISLEDAYNELVGNMMDALNSPEDFKYYLKDGRIPVLQVIEEEEEEE